MAEMGKNCQMICFQDTDTHTISSREYICWEAEAATVKFEEQDAGSSRHGCGDDVSFRGRKVQHVYHRFLAVWLNVCEQPVAMEQSHSFDLECA